MDEKLDKAIDLLQVAIMELEILKKVDDIDRARAEEIADRISKYLIYSADLIREGGRNDNFRAPQAVVKSKLPEDIVGHK